MAYSYTPLYTCNFHEGSLFHGSRRQEYLSHQLCKLLGSSNYTNETKFQFFCSRGTSNFNIVWECPYQTVTLNAAIVDVQVSIRSIAWSHGNIRNETRVSILSNEVFQCAAAKLLPPTTD